MYEEYPALGTQLKKLKLGNYLEFGCGTGGFLKFVLDQNASFTTVTAIDINPKAVEQAKEYLTNYRVKFITQDVLPLPIESNQFSTITLSNTLHHLRDKDSVFKELKRLLHSEGQIIITEMVRNDLSEAEQTYCRFHALRAEVDRLNGTFHDTTYSSDEIVNLVMDKGLSIIKKQIIFNEKQVIIDSVEIQEMESSIDDLVQGERAKPGFEALNEKAEKIKESLRQFGMKRPRQLHLKTHK